MITHINGVTVPASDPMHRFTGAALELRVNEYAREIERKRARYERERKNIELLAWLVDGRAELARRMAHSCRQ